MAEVPQPVSAATDIHYQTVSQRVPARLINDTPQQRQALRAQLPPALPWLATARVSQPGLVKALLDEYQRHQQHVRTVDTFLAQLPSAEDFAEPLLREAIKERFGLDLDVRRTFLFNAARARVAEAHIAQGDPVARAFQVVKAATQPLLLAALQNFEAFEAAEGGMQDALQASRLFTSETGQVMDAGRDVDLVPERFAALCRDLDLGGRYQRLIESLFQPVPGPEESAEAAAANRQARFKLLEQSSLRLELHLACLRGQIEPDLYDALLEVTKNASATGDLERAALSLWDVELNGIVLFSRPGCLVVYMPDEPSQPLQVFSSVPAFRDALRERLKDAAWRDYFLRFVPARERGPLLQRIQRTLYPKVWNPGGWYEEGYDSQASLHLDKQAFTAPLFNILLQRKIAALKDDGLFHAVPTAEQDHKSAQAKVDYVLNLGFNVLNVAAFVVPVLGEVMLGVNAALLGYEVYEGFDSLSKGEREEAWNYFMDVGENLALIAALGAAGATAQVFDGHLPVAVRSMRPVTLADGSVRLWKPDLSPFAHEVRLPEGLPADANGLYRFQGRQWLKLDGRYYSVRTLMDAERPYVLEHPTRIGAYEPSVRPNGNGGWLHELDAPQEWRGMELFRRQGPLEAGVSEVMARRALRISGVSESVLRRTLVDSRRPPALLSDSLRRLLLAETTSAETFAAAYHAQQAPLSQAGRALQASFGGLPNGVVEEIVDAATASERGELVNLGRVPLRLAQEARIYQQQVRIARACEGLYLDIEASADSARLLLHALENLPDWPANLRIGLYEGSLNGLRLTGIGAAEGAEVAVVWQGQTPQDFCQALFEAIPAAERQRLGLDDAFALRRTLQEQRLAPRQRLREWLGLPPVKPAFRSPMRLADGRIGMPLSGRGLPFFTEDELLDKLRLLELEDVHVEDALQALYRSGLGRVAINARLNRLLDEMQQLRHCLDAWGLESASETLSLRRQRSRERIGLALWEHWRRGILPELGQPASRLILSQVQLADLPGQLPGFFRERVRSLLLDQVIQREGAVHEQTLGENHVQALARQFPNLTALDIHRGEWSAGLPQMVARAWPRLRALVLRELRIVIGPQDMRALAALERLRWLDLRALNTLDMPVSALNGMTLDYLGLDWLGLSAWPQWLDGAALARIGEVSLVGNRLSEVPPDILEGARRRERPTRIDLQGNRFSFQVLLDLRLAEHFQGCFSFELGLSRSMEQEMNRRIVERSQLRDALRAWADDPAQAPDRLVWRRGVGREMLAYWRDDLRGEGTALLSLEDFALEEFPRNLPAFFFERVRRLELTRFSATPASLDAFIGQFAQLVELSLVDGRSALARVPESLASFAGLRELALVRMGLTIDQTAMEAFARMPMLSSLQLDGNRLGVITDMSPFNQRYLTFLGLGQMQIAAWPAWLEQLLPHGIEQLNLDDNLLTELPPALLANRRVDDGSVEIVLHNNPLTRETMIQAHVSQRYNRPYSFTMDLPEDIAAMAPQPHPSDSEDSSSADDSSYSESSPGSIWQTGDVDQDAHNRALWDGLEAEGDAGALLSLVSRLRYSADYRALNTRPELVARVWNVLAVAAQDNDVRLTLNGMAEEPLEQLHRHDTCPDGIRLEFNQMELQVYTRQALRQVADENRGPALFRLMRGIFRVQTLDRLAREQARGRDEAEVRLAYRLRWVEQLELPLPPRGMLYRSAADIAAGELTQVLNRVLTEESGQGLLRFGAQCDFWVAWLREAFAERFRGLKEAYEAAVLAATEDFPDETVEQSAVRIRALEEKFKSDEQALLETLTLEQSLTRP